MHLMLVNEIFNRGREKASESCLKKNKIWKICLKMDLLDHYTPKFWPKKLSDLVAERSKASDFRSFG